MTGKEIKKQALKLEKEYSDGTQGAGLHSIGRMNFEQAVSAIRNRRKRKPRRNECMVIRCPGVTQVRPMKINGKITQRSYEL